MWRRDSYRSTDRDDLFDPDWDAAEWPAADDDVSDEEFARAIAEGREGTHLAA